jgi:hypothetical protein
MTVRGEAITMVDRDGYVSFRLGVVSCAGVIRYSIKQLELDECVVGVI